MAVVDYKELLSAARRYLAITWDDPELDQTLAEDISAGVTYIKWIGAGGDDLTFSVGTDERRLLLEWLLFKHNGLLAEYSTTFERDLNSFQLRREAAEIERKNPDVQ